MMKLMRKSLPQNLVILRYSGLRVRTHAMLRVATTVPRPMVRGTIMKWYTVVMPNCHRAMSTMSTLLLEGS